MLTYKELIELRKKLANGGISLEHAEELFWKDFKEDKRSWRTKDWKERRAKVIKDKCEICSSKETLTIQHLSHPIKYNEHKKVVTKEYTRSFIESNPTVDKDEFSLHIKKNYDYIPVPLCPNCESRYPNERSRKTPRYLCTVCLDEFDETIYKPVDNLLATFFENEEATEVRDKCFISKDQWRNKHHLPTTKYWFQREKAKTRYNEEIRKETLLLSLDDNIKYLSLEDTITACKRCAYSYDMHSMELCPQCKEYYKGIQYPSCIQCLPEEKRKAAFEKIDFNKEMDEMHKRLGID
ncbi:hypothetical protein [Rhodohalobacter barkolensis]|uniref:Uncharacterized protein n=1 Tax=Rhodohalobacter barkolensis TaxID=2053187 RepID=A0A2N0VHX0_9BACT|nr:hypothetical protein [Rhodohalobacter barkolensis]PKD43769.1 hypothetical protein CWD77_09425 [Rhodohalobacter barkolensis]